MGARHIAARITYKVLMVCPISVSNCTTPVTGCSQSSFSFLKANGETIWQALHRQPVATDLFVVDSLFGTEQGQELGDPLQSIGEWSDKFIKILETASFVAL